MIYKKNMIDIISANTKLFIVTMLLKQKSRVEENKHSSMLNIQHTSNRMTGKIFSSLMFIISFCSNQDII